MPKMRITALYFILLIFLAGCGDNYKTEDFYSMGTFVSITLKKNRFSLATDARALVSQLENKVTTETDKANKTQNFQFDGIMRHLYDKGEDFSDMTDGRFSVFAYTIGKLYGFHEGPYHEPSEEAIDQALDDIDKMNNVQMDLGAFAKGYIVDRTVGFLKEKKVKSALVNAGGDLYALGTKGDRKWRVAIKHPDEEEKFISIISLENTAVATSGDYERFFMTKDGRRVFHIFDATTGKNPPYYRSVSVIANDTETADGLATAFFLLPPDIVEKKCKKLKTPVLLYTKEANVFKLCGWEKFENYKD